MLSAEDTRKPNAHCQVIIHNQYANQLIAFSRTDALNQGTPFVRLYGSTIDCGC
jgi:hypothetical protein